MSSPDAAPREAPHEAGAPRPAADVGVIVVAGGSGTRVGRELKQFRWVAGRPMLLHSVQTFLLRADVCAVVAVLPRSHAGDPPPWLFQCDLERLVISVGGRDRAESVYNGLEDLPEQASIVLVHDAARPLVPGAVVDRVIAEARRGGGAVAALPVVDTLKRVDDDGLVVATVERTGLWRAQTPQGFPRDVLVRAHRAARAERVTATDDAALVERIGIPVRVVRGSERALKVTEEADFAHADAMSALAE